jgi:tetratricopeptide (TPR) repeat protein
MADFKLTLRQREVLAMFGRVGTAKLAAAEFDCTENCMRSHMARIREETGLPYAIQIVDRAYRQGLLPLDDAPTSGFCEVPTTFTYAPHLPEPVLSAAEWAGAVDQALKDGDLHEALRRSEEARARYSGDRALLSQAGMLYQWLERWDDARRCLERAAEGREGRDRLEARRLLALFYRRMGDLPHCVEVLHAILRECPAYDQARRDLNETMRELSLRKPSTIPNAELG